MNGTVGARHAVPTALEGPEMEAHRFSDGQPEPNRPSPGGGETIGASQRGNRPPCPGMNRIGTSLPFAVQTRTDFAA